MAADECRYVDISRIYVVSFMQRSGRKIGYHVLMKAILLRNHSLSTLCRALLNVAGHLLSAAVLLIGAAAMAAETEYFSWSVENLAIAQPLGGRQGDAARGRQIVVARDKGNCLACHMLPIAEELSHGTIAPPLYGVGARLSEGELRLRVVDEKRVNPETIMPSFYRHPSLYNRPRPDAATTILTAQEVEDVVAYLKTLR